MAEPLVIFGGSFDPVHNGHLIVARAVAEAKGFQRITLMPTGAPPHKRAAVASGERRVEMLRAAVEGDALFEVSDLEVRRGGASYTIDTIEELRRLHGRDVEIHWIIGADMLEDLHRWRQAGEVVDGAQILVALRPPWDQRIEGLLAGLREHFRADQVERLEKGVVRTPLIDISSSEIRRRLAAGLDVRFLAPEAVLSVITRTGIYG